MQNTLKISIETLTWAAKLKGKSLSDFTHDLYHTDSTIQNILHGQLTFSQIKKIADEAKVPLGFMFLPRPPKKYTPDKNLVDFRTIKNKKPFSDDFIEIYKDVEHKQSWYREYLIHIDSPKLEFVGKYRENKNIDNKIIAREIRSTIGIELIPNEAKSADEYYSILVKHCENIGILVFKNSVVINSNKRKLDLEEFRGFSIADSYAPAIFINGGDTNYANVFTLAHELAHIWMGDSGISDAVMNSKNEVEIKCNEIAAEILVPMDSFIQMWESKNINDREKIRALNKIFKVSELVIARIALTNNRITKELYNQIQTEVMQRVQTIKNKKKDKPNRIPLKITIPIKNSRRITQTVIDLVKSDQMGPSEAAILLNTSASQVASL
ncbi:MAG: ImmA/IrrE family metallo-endopeptidase [Deltaproteobacteria bacterium]|nr:ImmA/IrrE family metallo-endopeptidase [Deltaproteobacteria bacterium]